MATRLSTPLQAPHLHSSSSSSTTIKFHTTVTASHAGTPNTQPTMDSDEIVLAHVRELSRSSSKTNSQQPGTFVTSTRHARWHALPPTTAEAHGIPASAVDSVVALWEVTDQRRPRSHAATEPAAQPTPLIHIPHCRLEITEFERGGMIERVALPRAVVHTMLSRLPFPDGVGPRHFDDDDEWVYSRCLLSDFSGMDAAEAAWLSSQGRLCCWASVVLMRHGDRDVWDLGIVVHKVLADREPGSGRCSCA
ncbi:hypothetical protein QBC39DRAFT_345009 [Podospora conica]|nr:hypothetical protein QBC39DRAFT_345009 [Schizothecium conicum]